MRLLSSLLVRVGRHAVMSLGVIAVCAATVASAQTPAAPQTDALKFPSDTAVLVLQIKGDKTADFESGFAEMRTLISASGNDDMKGAMSGVTLYKIDVPQTPDKPALYVIYVNPVSKTMSYDFGKLLYVQNPPAADAPAGTQGAYVLDRKVVDPIYTKLHDAVVGINPWPLKKIGG